ncbi:hypothetical protein [Cohnella cholangitidis]|uniref:Uncharacterized protein n=1 Tax=Cohnella cholangitidis TaxID=2598458 RepID=A0A7G5BSI7_9BACL|nr:hypothetical protein [Cohnella cholangitidis]QMV39921.1 hypothetical protein FPL14_00890 [Cohnella cholangitidis]
MNRYLKLVHMEVHRFRYILAGLMAFTMIIQFVALIWHLNEELNMHEKVLIKYGYPVMDMSFAQAIASTQFLFTIPIIASISVLILYIFFIWYRDWLGRNTFVYRLLMLPTARSHIYLAKLTAMLLFVFGLISFQLLLLPIEHFIFKLMVPAEQIKPSYFMDAVSVNQAFELLLPRNLDQFVLSYGIGVMSVVAVFTAILLERSYRLIGIVYGVLYLLACLLAFSFPLFAGIDTSDAYLYPEEIWGIELLICVLIVTVSIWLGFRLITKKVSV